MYNEVCIEWGVPQLKRTFTVTVKQDISRVRVSGGTFLIIYAMQGHADSGMWTNANEGTARRPHGDQAKKNSESGTGAWRN